MAERFSSYHRGGAGSPLVCLHGFTDTWRTWELALPHLERHHDVLAPTLLGHAGGPPLNGGMTRSAIADAVERAMDDAGFDTAHIAGNSLGGFVALQLAARGRARSVVALAPAGGWADDSYKEMLQFFPAMREQVRAALPYVDAIVATREGRRQATRFAAENFEHIPPGLIAHQIHGVASCDAIGPMVSFATREGYDLDAAAITCPVRIVWGSEDKLLPWPSAAARFRRDWLPNADWVELEGVGHCLQLDIPLETAELITGFTLA